MEFSLPSNLKNELVGYDPTLKAALKAAKSTTTKKSKPKYPLGNVNNLIPEHIVSSMAQQEAVDRINGASPEYRFKGFYSLKMQDGQESTGGIYAFIYHFESVWSAAWLPTEEDEGKYLYGFSIAYKNNSSSSKRKSSLGLHLPAFADLSDKWSIEKFGSTYFSVVRIIVTKEDIEAGKLTHPFWNISNRVRSYYKKSTNIHRQVVDPFKDKLLSKVPHWKDGFDNSIWGRVIKDVNTYANVLKVSENNYKYPDHIIPDVDSAIDVFTGVYETASYLLDTKVLELIRKSLNTPFFRRWLDEECKSIVSRFEDENNHSQKKVVVGWNRIGKLATFMKFVYKVWPDAPIDYFRNNLDAILTVRTRMQANPLTAVWLGKHMKVESFFTIISKYYETVKCIKATGTTTLTNGLDAAYETIDCPYFYLFSDTINMLERVLRKNHEDGTELSPPKRWRIEEFHDYVQSESWKYENENVSLPQDLFPVPIKVTFANEVWTFLQPINTHQLAHWGQAVRNCVGSASTYAEGVKKKQHFIVLCMVNSKPRFTVQLKVDNGVMHVSQIVDISNKRLMQEQKDEYTAAFSLALSERERTIEQDVVSKKIAAAA